MQIVRKELLWGGRKLILETGRVARQATGSVWVQYGDTVVLCTVVGAPEANPSADFFPLSVHYLEKTYAVGKFPGGFFKRESKPSEKEVLTSRLIDRPIRPLFPDGFFNEIQVVCMVLSYDLENDSDIVAMIGASAALSISGIPFQGPIAGARVGYQNGQYILNPLLSQLPDSQMDLIVAGTEEGVLMVESEISELPEDVVLGAVDFGHKALQPVIHLIQDLVKEAGKQPWAVIKSPEEDTIAGLLDRRSRSELAKIYQEPAKKKRQDDLRALKKIVVAELVEAGNPERLVERLFKALCENVMRHSVLKTARRIDGRGLEDIRKITCQTEVLPRAHGSALFTRGDTQALVVLTLGASDDAQLIDALEGEYKESFLLHYNFPAFSVGETSRMGPPGRREIGHGKLAWRAIHPLLPGQGKFPYTLRAVSEITESDGSSSMATVCGTSLALMDAGVPLSKPVAGIAMGLIKEGADYAILSDILGDEDSLGDMDFKVAGTDKGITALQMDLKISSVTTGIMAKALDQARAGRLHILDEMAKALYASRKNLNAHAPRMETIQISKDKIRDIIGPGGKVIREICESTGAKIDIDDDGTVKVFATDLKGLEAALTHIRGITYEPQVGDLFEGKVVKIMDFGAFVNFSGQDGLVHVSEIADKRVEKVDDVLKVGEVVRVKVIGFDARGKIKLSIKQASGNGTAPAVAQDAEADTDLESESTDPENGPSKPEPQRNRRRAPQGDRGRAKG